MYEIEENGIINVFKVFHFIFDGFAVGIGKSWVCEQIHKALNTNKRIIPLILDDCLVHFRINGINNDDYLKYIYNLKSDFSQQVSVETMLCTTPAIHGQEKISFVLKNCPLEKEERNRFIILLGSRDMVRSCGGFGDMHIPGTSVAMLDALLPVLDLYTRIGEFKWLCDLEILASRLGFIDRLWEWGFENMNERGRVSEIEFFNDLSKYVNTFKKMMEVTPLVAGNLSEFNTDYFYRKIMSPSSSVTVFFDKVVDVSVDSILKICCK